MFSAEMTANPFPRLVALAGLLGIVGCGVPEVEGGHVPPPRNDGGILKGDGGSDPTDICSPWQALAGQNLVDRLQALESETGLEQTRPDPFEVVSGLVPFEPDLFEVALADELLAVEGLLVPVLLLGPTGSGGQRPRCLPVVRWHPHNAWKGLSPCGHKSWPSHPAGLPAFPSPPRRTFHWHQQPFHPGFRHRPA